MLKKKYVPALIMLLIIFVVQGKAWNKRTVFTALVFVIGIVFIDRFTSILDTLLAETQYSDIITNEIWTTDDGTNIFRILFYSIPAIMSLIWKKHIDAGNNKQINMFVNCTAITAFLYAVSGVASGIYGGRLPIYTTLAGYVAVPWMIDHIFTESSARIVNNRAHTLPRTYQSLCEQDCKNFVWLIVDDGSGSCGKNQGCLGAGVRSGLCRTDRSGCGYEYRESDW